MTRRLLWSYLTLTLFVLLLLEVPLAVFFQQRETDRFTADIERDATVLATIFEDSLEDGTEVDPVPAREYGARTGSRVVVVDRDGVSLLDTALQVPRDFSTRPEFELALVGQRATGTRFSTTLDSELLYVAVPVASGGNVHGALRLTFDTDEVDNRVRAFWWGLLAVGAVVLVVVAAFGWALSRSILRPIRRLQSSAARFSGGDLTRTELDTGAPPELAELQDSLNTMALRLDRLLEQQRAFVADASHQLRTPLTALRLRLENLQSVVVDQSQHDDIDEAIDETDRLAHLVTDLLQLASAEKVSGVEPCDLATVARERLSTWTEVAAESHVTLTLQTEQPKDVWANCTPGGVEQILDNLLSNAIEASPAGSSVEIALTPGRAHHEMRVIDHGPGLPEEQQQQALERFWRADSSKPGTGLGLAIVKSLVLASRGTVRLETTKPQGLTVRVTLEAAEAAVASPDRSGSVLTIR